MRKYRYQFILHTEDGTDVDFVYYAYGVNKKDAVQKIDLFFPFSIKSGKRVNINS
jgi:hypothetical protein